MAIRILTCYDRLQFISHILSTPVIRSLKLVGITSKNPLKNNRMYLIPNGEMYGNNSLQHEMKYL